MMGAYDSIFGVPGPGSFISQGGLQWRPATGLNLDVGQVVRDLGDYIITAAGEVLQTAIDEFGRRIVTKTGEVLSHTPLGPATTVPYVRQMDWLPIALVLGAVLLLRR